MTKRIKVADLPDFDAAPYLDNEEAVAAYLTDILEANDPALLAAALGDIARARRQSFKNPPRFDSIAECFYTRILNRP